MIVCSYRNSYDEYRKLTDFHIFRVRLLPQICCCGILFAAAIVLFVLAGLDMTEWYWGAALIVMAVLLPFANAVMARSRIRQREKREPEYEKRTNRYAFDENGLTVTIKDGKCETVSSYDYQELCIYETKTHFYLYVNQMNAYILPKSCLSATEISVLIGYFKAGAGKNFKGQKHGDKL